MTQLDILATGATFDGLKHVDADGTERWSARELMTPLGYGADWRNYADAISRAKAACNNSGHDAGDHFVETTKMVRIGSGAQRRVPDFHLTRYAAYLLAMNGDSRKSAIAAAQTYFAVKTREAEIRDENKARHKIPQSFADALQLAADQARKIERQQNTIAVLEPKAEQADFHRAADGLIAVGDFANKLKAWAQQEHAARILHQDVWNFLGDINLLIRGNTIRRNQPTAWATERGYVLVKETEYETNNHGTQTATSPRLTPAGEGYAWDRAVRRIAEHGSLAPLTAVAVPSQSLPAEWS